MERKRNRKRANWNAFIYNGIALCYNAAEKHWCKHKIDKKVKIREKGYQDYTLCYIDDFIRMKGYIIV